MSKKIDLNRSVFELTEEYPELINIMSTLGFTEITKKPMLHSVGKIMTIPKGAKMKDISMMDIVAALMANGFELVGEMPEMKLPDPAGEASGMAEISPDLHAADRTELLKGYLRRLGSGEDLESVRADFVREFEDVDASEIMKAEQELMKEGTPLSEVQRLCDIHSALFHGATREEQIAKAEKAVEESLLRQRAEEEMAKRDAYPQKDYSDKNAKAAELEKISGHPLQTLTRENDALTDLLNKYKTTKDTALIPQIRELSVHYAKKGDLLYPLLKVKYGISGPSDVMWTVDDEIRDEIGALCNQATVQTARGDEWEKRLETVLKRIEEMIYKEQNILFPICAVNYTEEEWKGIYRDAKDYADCLGIQGEVWNEAESGSKKVLSYDGEIVMPGGHMTVEQLTALLNTIPMDIAQGL